MMQPLQPQRYDAMRLDFVRVCDQTLLHLRVPLEILDNAPRAFCRYFHGYGFTPARMSSALERRL